MTGEELLKRVNKEIDVLSSPKIVDALVEASKAKAPEPHLNLSEEMPKVIEHHIENFKKVAEELKGVGATVFSVRNTDIYGITQSREFVRQLAQARELLPKKPGLELGR